MIITFVGLDGRMEADVLEVGGEVARKDPQSGDIDAQFKAHKMIVYLEYIKVRNPLTHKSVVFDCNEFSSIDVR